MKNEKTYMVNTDNAEKKVFATRSITYGTMKNLEVKIHTYNGGMTVDSVARDFVRAFIIYMTKNAMVSDEVLFSSIGENNFREAVILGAPEQFNDKEFAEAFIRNIKDSWEYLVLTERYGHEEGYRKSLVRDLGEEKAAELIKAIEAIEASRAA